MDLGVSEIKPVLVDGNVGPGIGGVPQPGLVEGVLQPGYHRVIWNGRATNGSDIPTGVYITRLTSPAFTKTIKLILLK